MAGITTERKMKKCFREFDSSGIHFVEATAAVDQTLLIEHS